MDQHSNKKIKKKHEQKEWYRGNFRWRVVVVVGGKGGGGGGGLEANDIFQQQNQKKW